MEEENPSTTRLAGIVKEEGEKGLKEVFGMTTKKRINSNEDTSLSKKPRILQMTNVVIKEEVECSSCTESFSTYHEFLVHQKSFHPLEHYVSAPIQCDVCRIYRFYDNNSFMRHRMTCPLPSDSQSDYTDPAMAMQPGFHDFTEDAFKSSDEMIHGGSQTMSARVTKEVNIRGQNSLPVMVKEENEMDNTGTPDSDVIYRILRDDVKEEVKEEVIEEHNNGFTQDSFPLYSYPIVPMIPTKKTMELNGYPKEWLEKSTLCQNVAGTSRMIPEGNDIGYSVNGRIFTSEDERLMALEGIDSTIIKYQEQNRTLTSHPGVFKLPNQTDSFIFTYDYLDVKTVDYLITIYRLGSVFITKIDLLLFLGDPEREFLWHRRTNCNKKLWLRKLFHVWFGGKNDIAWMNCVEAIDMRTIERVYEKNMKVHGKMVDHTKSLRSMDGWIYRRLNRPLSKIAAAFGLKMNIIECPFCEKPLCFGGMGDHVRIMHNDARERLFGCRYCNVWCKSVKGAYSHYERKGCILSIRNIEEARKPENNKNGKDTETSKACVHLPIPISKAVIPEATEQNTEAAPIIDYDLASMSGVVASESIHARSMAISNEQKHSSDKLAKNEDE